MNKQSRFDIRVDLNSTTIDGMYFCMEVKEGEMIGKLGFANCFDVSKEDTRTYWLKCNEDIKYYSNNSGTVFLGSSFVLEVKGKGGMIELPQARQLWKSLLESGRFEYEQDM
jgi:hypothetical protein